MLFAKAVKPYIDRDPREPYLPIAECAERMGNTVDQVSVWSRRRLLVQPV
jgi:hypothetical protein